MDVRRDYPKLSRDPDKDFLFFLDPPPHSSKMALGIGKLRCIIRFAHGKRTAAFKFSAISDDSMVACGKLGPLAKR